MASRPVLFLSLLLAFSLFCVRSVAARESTNQVALATRPKALSEALSPSKWKQVEASVDRALAWMAAQQAGDGSFPTLPSAQPSVTSLCVLAFLSRGLQPGIGPYGRQLNRAIDFVISCQKSDGLFSYETPAAYHQDKGSSHTASYNHAIAGLMLGEVYGHVSGQRAREVKQAIEKALRFARDLQTRPKAHLVDQGGWRYLRVKSPGDPDSDLSVTAWQLMFLRSARNAEFAVPQAYVDDAMKYVYRCWDEKNGLFSYALRPSGAGFAASRGMMGAGILSLSLAGQHQTAIARSAGAWLLAHPYGNFGQSIGTFDRYFYSMYYCSQAAAQLGGRYWEGVFPPLADALLSDQSPDGSWPPEPRMGDAVFGSAYTTALAVLSLTPPYQLLPVYQR